MFNKLLISVIIEDGLSHIFERNKMSFLLNKINNYACFVKLCGPSMPNDGAFMPLGLCNKGTFFSSTI